MYMIKYVGKLINKTWEFELKSWGLNPKTRIHIMKFKNLSLGSRKKELFLLNPDIPELINFLKESLSLEPQS